MRHIGRPNWQEVTMIQTLDEILDATIALPVQEKLALFRALSLALEQDRTFSALNATFWEQRSLADLITAQQVPIATDLSDLATDCWPPNETADEFIAYVRERRVENRWT
jgi:hypothetical protein